MQDLLLKVLFTSLKEDIMATKKKTTTAKSSGYDPDKALASANIALRASINAAAVISDYSASFGEQDVAALAHSLSDLTTDVWKGNMKKCESMLLGQAHALQAIFTHLSRRAAKQEYLKHIETLLRLALKAQGQCRATIETLAAIKNPPVMFAQQANIAHGPQQVNNGASNAVSTQATRAEKTKSDRNELLEVQNEQRLDTRTASTSGKEHSKLEALEAVNRPTDQ
jgi:hypothetical protein